MSQQGTTFWKVIIADYEILTFQTEGNMKCHRVCGWQQLPIPDFNRTHTEGTHHQSNMYIKLDRLLIDPSAIMSSHLIYPTENSRDKTCFRLYIYFISTFILFPSVTETSVH